MAASNPMMDSPGDETLAAYKALGMGFLERSKKPGSIGRLGHYEILSRLGEGGYGMVLKAFDEKLQRDVAIKVLSSEFGPGSTPRARFIREARAAAVIRHENVVAIYAVEEEPNPYLVMEYVPGVTLQTLVDKNTRLPAKDALLAGAHIARGLAAAHEKGLIHRDIKPCNILVEKVGDGYVSKIADFGLALSSTDARLTQSGMVAGTPMYMSPEQARGDTLDARSDLFSLGCVLYTLLTGQPPFGDGNPMTVLHAIIQDQPKPIREFAPDAPKWLCEIIAKLMAKKRENRYQSAKEVAKVFTDALEHPPADGASAKTAPTRKAGSPGGETAAAGGRRWLIVALLLLAAAAGGFAAYHFLKPPPPAESKANDPPGGPNGPLPHSPSNPSTRVSDLLPHPLGVPWTAAKRLELGVNTPDHELSPTLTADELVIVFLRKDRLFTSQRPNANEPFPPAWEVFPKFSGKVGDGPTLSADGLVLAFPSDREAGDHIWMSERKSVKDPFPDPESRDDVGMPGGERAPLLSANARTLFVTALSSQQIVAFSRAGPGQKWKKGEGLPEAVNRPSVSNVATWLSPDGRVLVATSPDEGARYFVLPSADAPFGSGQELSPPSLPEELNGRTVGRPWFSPDGKRVYFHLREKANAASSLGIWTARLEPKK